MKKSLDIQSGKRKPAAVKKTKRKVSRVQKTLAGTIGLVALIVALLGFLILPEASIKVFARTEPVTRDFEITISKDETKPNPAELSVPAQIITEEISDTKSFPATGVKNVGRKASGFVYLYNFSKITLMLKAATTVLTAGDRKYYFTQDVTGIRPTAFIGLENQEVDQTSLIPPVPVVAAAPGEIYNLAKKSRMEIENEVFGKQPKTLYAVVAEDLSGGTTKEIKFVTSDDITAAGNALAADIVARELEKLGATEESALIEVLEKKAAVAAETETFEFEASAKVKIQALTYDPNDIQEIVTSRIERLLPKNKALRNDKTPRIVTKFMNISVQEGRGILAAHYEGEVVYQLNAAELIGKLKGKTAEEIREILLSRPEVADVQIKFYPSWVKKAPKFEKKLYLEVALDE